MGIIQVVVTSIVTSGIITTLIIFLVKRYIEQILNKQLEAFKADLSVSMKVREKLLNKKIQFYPQLVELLYRSRNYARDIANSKKESSTKNQLEEVFYSLENDLYQYRLDIDEDDFKYLHKYKNTLRTFIGISNRIFNSKNTSFTDNHIVELYSELDNLYNTITNKLKQKLVKYTDSN